jgi:SprT protein
MNEKQQAHRLHLNSVLAHYLPPQAVDYCAELIMRHKLHLHIEVERKDRLGDYHPHMGYGNRISINHNLNPYDFLITFIHELAHHTTHQKSGPRHQAHGKEWKEEFKNCMRPLVMRNIFPADIRAPLINHMKHPKYTHSGDIDLMRALMKYDRVKNYSIMGDLPEGALFRLNAKGRIVLKKGAKRRTYFECVAPQTGAKYVVHEAARVFPAEAVKT